MNKAAKICEKADLIREKLSYLAAAVVAGSPNTAAKYFDEIFELTADIKSVAHNEED